MKRCKKCGHEYKKIWVAVEGAKNKTLTYQCNNCGYFEFDKKSSLRVERELRKEEHALKIKHKLIRLSHNRLGMYFNKHIIDSLRLKAGKDVYVTVPSKKKLEINL